MPTALIFGGNGKVARHLTTLLVSKSYKVHSLIRSESQIPSLESLGANPIVQSIEDSTVQSLTETLHSHAPIDVVIWAAGAGGGNPERTKAVDHEGAIKCWDACAAAGVKRVITVSALDVRDKTMATPEWYNHADKERSEKVWGFIGPYMRAKFAADKDLVTGNAGRGLQYTIVRPGGLTNEKGVGKVEAGKVHLDAMVSREDVAEVVWRCIEDEGTKGLAFDVVGGEMGIQEAVEKVARDKVDTFEGHY